jgi:O-antigen/teichoic acid export membrane protein
MSLKKSSILAKLRNFSFFDSFKHASVYFSGTILIQGLGIISLPVMTYFLSPEEYGIVNVYLSYTLIASVIFSLNLEWSITRYFLEPNAQKKAFLSTVFTAVTVLYTSSALCIYLFRENVGQFLNLSPQLVDWLMLYSYTSILWYVYLFVRIAENNSRELTIMQVLNQYLKFAVSVAGILYLKRYGGSLYMGKIIGEFFVNGVLAIFLFYLIRKYFDFRNMKWSYLRYAAIYSLPLVPYALGGQILSSFDQWYINVVLGPEKAGLYSFAYKISLLMFGLITALHNASLVQYTKLMDEQKYKDIATQSYSIHKLTLLAGLFLILFSVDLGTLLSSKASFREALSIVPIIILGNILYGLAMLYTRIYNYKKTNIFVTVIFLSGAVVNIVLNMLFVKDYGYEASAYTTLFSYALMALMAWIINDFWMKFPALPIGKIILSILPLFALTFAFYKLGWETLGMNFGLIALKILLMMFFGIVLFFDTLRKLIKR